MTDERHESRDAPENGGAAAGREDIPPQRRLDDTAGLPVAEETVAAPAAPRPWLGRAAVRAPGAPGVREAAPMEWEGAGEQQYRQWWMPILVAIVALLLLAVLGYGVWLIAGARGTGPTPVVPAPTAPNEPSAAAPSTVAPTTGAPTPSTTASVAVPVPPLIGLPDVTARALLDQLGLSYRLQFQVAPQPADTIIETDPPAGTPVTPDQPITLVIAEPPAVPPTTATPSAPVRSTPTPRSHRTA
jgi:hypothetical protein